MDWDLYFMQIARTVSKKSHCMSRQIGAVLVRDNSIISTGYNGPARGVKHCKERPIGFYKDLEGTIKTKSEINHLANKHKKKKKENNQQNPQNHL